MKQYQDLLKLVLESGRYKADRTGTGCYSVFGAQTRFDLREGFPLLTTKKVHLKSIIHELLWFLSGDTNVKYLNDNGVTIWNEWADSNGDLFNIYSRQWRRWPSPISTQLIGRKEGLMDGPFIPPCNAVEQQCSDVPEDLRAERTNNNGDKFIVIREVNTKRKNKRYLIQFKNTTTLSEADRPNILNGQVQDPYQTDKFGVCDGRPNKKLSYYRRAYILWRNMVKRCLDETCSTYKQYGGDGITIAPMWKCFENFLNDLHKLPNNEEWKRNLYKFELDKDYFKAKQYGPTTSIFLPADVNKRQNKFSIPVEVTINGDIKHFQSISHAARSLGLKSNRLNEQFRHERTNYPNLLIKELLLPNNQMSRELKIVDQIQTVVERIKSNPSCRRLIVSAWNPAELDQMALPPCHALFQFFVMDGELSCQLYQRSADLFLGVPFNIASYALLTMMVAQVCGLKPGEFVHTFGDLHLYSNHLEQAKLQLSREPRSLPTMKINSGVKNIFDFKYEDFTLENYNPHPGIKAPISI